MPKDNKGPELYSSEDQRGVDVDGDGTIDVIVIANTPGGVMLAAEMAGFTKGLSRHQKLLLKESLKRQDLSPKECEGLIRRFKKLEKELTPSQKAEFANMLTQDMNNIGAPENQGAIAQAIIDLPKSIIGVAYQVLETLALALAHLQNMVSEGLSPFNTAYDSASGWDSLQKADSKFGASIKSGASFVSTLVKGVFVAPKSLLVGGRPEERMQKQKDGTMAQIKVPATQAAFGGGIPGRENGSETQVKFHGLCGVAIEMYRNRLPYVGKILAVDPSEDPPQTEITDAVGASILDNKRVRIPISRGAPPAA